MMMRALLLHPYRFCRDHHVTRTRASAYLDGELDEQHRGRVEAHMCVCPPCARFMAGLRRIVSTLRQLRTPQAAAVSVSDSVLARLRHESDTDHATGARPTV